MAEIELDNIGLRYPVYGATAPTSGASGDGNTTGGSIRRGRRRVEVEALINISLRARDGDRIGILGHNGAGKTSLLKVIAGILKPDRGRVRRVGKTVSIINPSVGLDQSLSGHENIEQIALLYGLSQREIELIRPDVVSFTELGHFLDLPVSTYSAGMITRLSFGVATAFHPEILVADENIGAGDARFLSKARERMQEMMGRSSLLILATHSVETVKQMCNRAILMEGGHIIADDDVNSVLSQYNETNR